MTIIGFNFTKLYAAHKKGTKGNLKVGTNVKIDSLERVPMVLDEKRTALKASFTYTVKYIPEIGAVEFQGDLLFLQEKKVAEALLAEWEKKKTIDRKMTTALVNSIMQRCTIQAMIMTRDIGLPPPIPMPKVKSSSVKVKDGPSAEKQ